MTRIYNGKTFEAECPYCGRWTDDVDDAQEHGLCFWCGVTGRDGLFNVQNGRYIVKED